MSEHITSYNLPTISPLMLEPYEHYAFPAESYARLKKAGNHWWFEMYHLIDGFESTLALSEIRRKVIPFIKKMRSFDDKIRYLFPDKCPSQYYSLEDVTIIYISSVKLTHVLACVCYLISYSNFN